MSKSQRSALAKSRCGMAPIMLELGRYKVLPLYVAFSQDIDETTLTLSHPDLRIVKEVARVCHLILDGRFIIIAEIFLS